MELGLTIAAIVIALLNCFFGYKLRKVWIAFIAFVVGYLLGDFIMGIFIKDNVTPAIITGIIVGVIFMLIGFKAYLTGVFILCGGLAFLICYIFVPEQWIAIVTGIAAGLLVGFIAIKVVKPTIILSTGIGSGMTAAGSLLSIFKYNNLIVVFVLGAVISALGIYYQFKSNKSAG